MVCPMDLYFAEAAASIRSHQAFTRFQVSKYGVFNISAPESSLDLQMFQCFDNDFAHASL